MKSSTQFASHLLFGKGSISISMVLGLAILSSTRGVLAQSELNPPQVVNLLSVPGKLGKETVVGSELLKTVDTETSDPTHIIYRIYPDDRTFRFTNGGGLFLGTRLLKGGDDFTQANVNEGKVKWLSPTNTATATFVIPFRVRDEDLNEAVPPDGGVASGVEGRFGLVIQFENTPPVAISGGLAVPRGATVTGMLKAANAEAYQKLQFSITRQPSAGVLTLTNPETGLFQFASGNANGSLEFEFQVFDGVEESVETGHFTLVMEDGMPVVFEQSFTGLQDEELIGQLRGIDPDIPPHPLTFKIKTPPNKGAIFDFDASTGSFFYRPFPGRFGRDEFIVEASDGARTSLPVTMRIDLRGVPDDGTLFLSGKDDGVDGADPSDNGEGIYMVNPENGDAFRLYTGPKLVSILSLSYEVRTRELIYGEMAGNVPLIGAIDVETGASRIIVEGTPPLLSPFGMTHDLHHGVLIANGQGGIIQLDTDSGAQFKIPGSDSLKLLTGIFQGQDGDLLVLDTGTLFANDAFIYKINPTNGVQTLLIDQPDLKDVSDIVEFPDHSILVSSGAGLFKFNPLTRAEEFLVGSNAFQVFPKQIALHNDNIYVTDLDTQLLRLRRGETQMQVVYLELPIHPVAIAVVHQPDTINEWLETYFDDSGLFDPEKHDTVWGPKVDFDDDGLPNLLEFALDTDPLNPDSGMPLDYEVNYTEDGVVTRLTFRKRKNFPGVVYQLLTSSNFATWTTEGLRLIDSNNLGDVFQEEVYEFLDARSDSSFPQFFKLVVTIGPEVTY